MSDDKRLRDLSTEEWADLIPVGTWSSSMNGQWISFPVGRRNFAIVAVGEKRVVLEVMDEDLRWVEVCDLTTVADARAALQLLGVKPKEPEPAEQEAAKKEDSVDDEAKKMIDAIFFEHSKLHDAARKRQTRMAARIAAHAPSIYIDLPYVEGTTASVAVDHIQAISERSVGGSNCFLHLTGFSMEINATREEVIRKIVGGLTVGPGERAD